jgi:rhodanese-related sulfurtransferase
MPTSLKNLLAEAAASVPKISPQDAAALIAGGDVLVVDVRDGTEVQSTGKVQGAKHVPRGMLEFRADPDSPYYDPGFNRDKTVLVYCASGGRSAHCAARLIPENRKRTSGCRASLPCAMCGVRRDDQS